MTAIVVLYGLRLLRSFCSSFPKEFWNKDNGSPFSMCAAYTPIIKPVLLYSTERRLRVAEQAF